MIHVKKGDPWILFPSSLCDTFPEVPATKVLSGEHDFEINLNCTLLDTVDINATVFAILPKYTGLDIHKNLLFFTVKFEDETSEYFQFPFIIYNGVDMELKLIHKSNRFLRIYINDEEQLNLDLKIKGLYRENNSCIVFGANSYNDCNENSNITELNLHEFSLLSKNKLLAHHTFDNIIFNKSVDKTGNLNFIHNKIIK
jgi:hypothetical protein